MSSLIICLSSVTEKFLNSNETFFFADSDYGDVFRAVRELGMLIWETSSGEGVTLRSKLHVLRVIYFPFSSHSHRYYTSHQASVTREKKGYDWTAMYVV